jgi:hypothetical protein
MRQVLFALISVLVFGLYVGIGSAQQSSKGVVPKPGDLYNPVIVYAGDYEANELLFKNSQKDTVWRSVPKLNMLSRVTCSDAVAHLERDGRWQGYLKSDGSCGPTSEPADWALGNRLNYEEAFEQDAR